MLAVLKLPNRTFHLLESSIDQNVPFFNFTFVDASAAERFVDLS